MIENSKLRTSQLFTDTLYSSSKCKEPRRVKSRRLLAREISTADDLPRNVSKLIAHRLRFITDIVRSGEPNPVYRGLPNDTSSRACKDLARQLAQYSLSCSVGSRRPISRPPSPHVTILWEKRREQGSGVPRVIAYLRQRDCPIRNNGLRFIPYSTPCSGRWSRNDPPRHREPNPSPTASFTTAWYNFITAGPTSRDWTATWLSEFRAS